jgi:deazaflavin-dependent oxidoreductase (nitroreductase family)
VTDEHGRPAIQRRTEPIARALAGRRWFPLWAIVRHRGRRSGTEYETPIAVVPSRQPDTIVIGLPWGRQTNWARNVVAEGGTVLRWKGRDIETTSPRIVDAAEAAALARAPFGLVLKRMPAALVLRTLRVPERG